MFLLQEEKTALSRFLKFLFWKRKAIRTQFNLVPENFAFVFQSHSTGNWSDVCKHIDNFVW